MFYISASFVLLQLLSMIAVLRFQTNTGRVSNIMNIDNIQIIINFRFLHCSTCSTEAPKAMVHSIEWNSQ